MRPLSTRQSFLRYPLSIILSSEGSVRVLRELLRHGGELNPPVIARSTGVTPQHVRQTLGGLVETGMVEEVGQGRYLSYRARASHPLHPALDALFREEEERFDDALTAVREAVAPEQRGVASVWLYGSVARGEDSIGSDVDVAVVVSEGVVEEVVDRIRERLQEAEHRLGVQYSLLGLGADDVLRLSGGDPWWSGVEADALTLLGRDPARLAALLRRTKDQRPTETTA